MATTPTTSPHLPRIPGFQVLEQIGVGGYSQVYRALQLSVEREVAIKVLNKPFADDQERLGFLQECKAMGRLEHPHVVRVYDSAATEDGRGCIVMQLYSDTYSNVGRLPMPELIDVGMKVAAALQAAHDRDIVHHDVKPQNLFRSTDGEPALGDFGISSVGGRRTGRTRLTLKYAPPELLRDGVSDARGDIWALGVTLSQLASGRAPFDGTTDEETIRLIMTADPTPIERSDAPAGLERIVNRCLSKDPAGRPSSADEIATEFRSLQRGVGLPSSRPTARAPVVTTPSDLTADDVDLGRAREPTASPTPDEGAPSEAERPRSTGRVLAAIGVLAALVLAASLLAISLQGSDDTTPTETSTTTSLPFVVLVPPNDLAVTKTDVGFKFTWTAINDSRSIHLYRVGTDDNTLATENGFEWALERTSGRECFQARGHLDGRLSAQLSDPVCTD